MDAWKKTLFDDLPMDGLDNSRKWIFKQIIPYMVCVPWVAGLSKKSIIAGYLRFAGKLMVLEINGFLC